MIIDVHTHPPSHPYEVPENERKIDTVMRSGTAIPVTNSVADYLKAMEPVDKAFVFGIATNPLKPGRVLVPLDGWPEGFNENDVVAEVARRAPDKIVPFMSVHPLDPRVNDEYDRAVGDLGCKGIKLAPNYQIFDPVGEEAFRLYARLEADGIPAVFHQGTSPFWEAPLEWAHPLIMDRIAIRFPELKVVMAHLGHPWHVDTITVVRKHPNIWTDVSAQFYRPWSFWNGMRLFHEWGVTQKILFASDWSVSEPQDNIDGLHNLNKFARDHYLPGIPEDEIESIINRDALGILGVD